MIVTIVYTGIETDMFGPRSEWTHYVATDEVMLSASLNPPILNIVPGSCVTVTTPLNGRACSEIPTDPTAWNETTCLRDEQCLRYEYVDCRGVTYTCSVIQSCPIPAEETYTCGDYLINRERCTADGPHNYRCPQFPASDCGNATTAQCRRVECIQNVDFSKCRRRCAITTYQLCNLTLTDTHTFTVRRGYIAPSGANCWANPIDPPMCPDVPHPTNITSRDNCVDPQCQQDLVRPSNYTRRIWYDKMRPDTHVYSLDYNLHDPIVYILSGVTVFLVLLLMSVHIFYLGWWILGSVRQCCKAVPSRR